MRVLITVSSTSGGTRPFAIHLDSAEGEEIESGEIGSLAPPRELIQRYAAGDLQPGDVRELGRHLFDVLIGGSAWGKIRDAAAARATSAIELALCWPSTEYDLQQLPWETMHDGRAFLGADPDLSAAITRVVADATEVVCPDPVVAPVRVLFVLGAELDDPKIKAGAELIGLLRGVERNKGAISPSFLENATLPKVEERCRQLNPHIVHFVSHGGLDASGRGELKLQPGDPLETGWISGERLLGAMRAAADPPLLVVLTGCESAAAGDHMDSLAAELVKGGIPSVIGMAGEISDPVCRYFSREFGRALNTGAPLVQAMTEGRRAGLQRQEERAADDHAWALPSIYLSPKVPAGHAPVDAVGAAAAFDRVDQFKLGEGPVFCGHTKLLEDFDHLLDRDQRLNALVAYSRGDEKLGRTRLLHELAARALRSGHVVVMVDDRRRDNSLLPQTPIQLAAALARAIVETRQRFGLAVTPPAALRMLLEMATGLSLEDEWRAGASPATALKLFLGRCGKAAGDQTVVGAGLSEALVEDLAQLAVDARASDAAAVPAEARVLVILGGIGHWGTALELLLDDLIDANGLGSRESPVPVLASCSLSHPGGKRIEQAMQATRGSQWILYEQLARLGENEETLACQWVLLHPWRSDLEGAEKAYAPAPDPPAGGPPWEVAFKRLVKRLPGHLGHPFFYEIALVQEENKLLVGADDEKILRAHAAAGEEEAP